MEPSTLYEKTIYPVYQRIRPGGLLPYIGYIGMCGAKGYGFSAALVIDCSQSPIFPCDRRDRARLTVNGGHLDFQSYRV